MITLLTSCGKTWSASRPKFYTQSPFTIKHSVSLRSALNKVFFNFLYNIALRASERVLD